jgi:D-alanyl-D-alanine carboxypeptidase (penicillin-binding protein 5/6)
MLRKKLIFSFSAILIVILIAYAGFCLVRPITVRGFGKDDNSTLDAASTIQWPQVGEAAVGILGSHTIITNGPQTPTPTASVAKLITAVMVLKAKPLAVGEQGPSITFTTSDVAIYGHYLDEQGSVLPVVAGETMSEYQALEAMLLPSADNVADSLAIWAYGSLSAYSQAANTYIAAQGLHDTHVGTDASGYDPSTTSTAQNMVMLGELAMNNPVIASIVSQSNATGIPLETSIHNVNSLLGTDGIVGIKTGNTDQAGGVFVSASQITLNNKMVTVITALAKTQTLAAALKDSIPFIASTHTDFTSDTIIRAGSVVAHYQLPWGGTVPVIATQNVTLTTWKDSPTSSTISLRPLQASKQTPQTVGRMTAWQSGVASEKYTPLALQQALPQPSISWRLIHPLVDI